MKLLAHRILILVLYLVNGPVNAQFTEMYWKNIGVNDGLPGPTVRTIMQDSRGFIWVGTTDGISRFDGTHFTSYSTAFEKSDTLMSDHVVCIYEKRSSDLLIGTLEGFVEFDYKSGTFQSRRILIDGLSDEKINFIFGFCEWPDGTVWIATGAGTVEWNPSKDIFEMLAPIYSVSRYGTIQPFILDEDGLGAWVKLQGKIGHYDFERKEWNIPTFSFHKPGQINGERIIDGLVRDKNGVLWFTSLTDSAMYSYDPKTKVEEEIKCYREMGGLKEPLSVINMRVTSDEKIWMTTWNDYIRIFDIKSKTWKKIQYTISDERHIPFSNCNAIFQGINGDIWIGHIYGISIHSPAMEAATALPVPDFEGENKSPWYGANEFLQDKETGCLYVGCGQIGLIRYDSTLSKFDTFSIEGGDEFANSFVKLLWVNGELWCGTWKGLYIFNPKSETFRHFDPFKDGTFESTNIRGMVQTGDDIWFNCRNNRLYNYNLKTKRSELLMNDPDDSTSMVPYYTTYMIKDKNEIIWFGHNKGYSRFDPITRKFSHTVIFSKPLKFDINAVNGFVEDPDGFLWYSTRQVGLFRIDISTGSYKKWENSDLYDLKYFSALNVDEEFVWLGSKRGIVRLNKEKNELDYFLHDRSMLDVVYYDEAYRLADSRIVFFKNHRILLVSPEMGRSTTTIEYPLVSEVISGENKYMNVSNVIHLSSDQNYFTIHYSSVANASRSDIIYEYQLVGIDKDWVSANNRTEAAYNNIAGGEYTFRVRAKGASGNWVETNTPFSISIEKRFTETLFFKVLLFLILIGCLMIIMLWRKRIERRLTREKALNHFVDTSTQQSLSEISREMANIFVDDLSMKFAAVYISKTDNQEYNKVAERNNGPQAEDLITLPDSMSGPISMITERLAFSDGYTDYKVTPLVHESRGMGFVISKWSSSKIALENQNTVQAIAMVCAGKMATIKADSEVKQKEEVLAQINSLLTESQLVSLRAQMNPHFVFNCLNSIQESIVMKQYSEASLYLNKFSKLFRMVLNNSSRDLITLKEEMDVLVLYLELEHMRFQRSFDYTLQCDDELESDEILVPSMLLQPFVENALWHGLLHKESDRQLNIRFYARDEEIFVCEIEDNGIGRERAGQIKQQKSQTTSYESKGIKISMDRLNLINLKQNKHARVEIVDKKDEFGNPTGTKVTFELSQFLHQIQTPK